ncbi:hypothetical protein [Streptomyces sp. DH37]|uniref:hypothetical protein n=1 Tax=Streptomyces sp. DH37 TaxID=3040122 RepID=UPI002442D624|nr:hypothetical protein [Streptomyces sp. DH37]MDG9701515.1 hypothetical protein [Streptomyces sp. DH37]
MADTTTLLERACRTAADLIRTGALVSATAAVFFSLEGVFRFGLLLLALLVPRLAGLRSPVDLLVCVVLSVAAWSSPANWYELAPWYDTALHLVTPGTVAVTLHLLLIRARLLPSPRARGLRIASAPLLTVCLGCTVALLWELYEWFAEKVLGAAIVVGYDDTVLDMAAGLTGSLVAGGLLVSWAHSGPRAHRDRDTGPLPG